MLKPYALFATILLSCSLFAQKDKGTPPFGKIEKSDLTLTSCNFDKDAEAMVLFDVEEVYCRFNNSNIGYPVTTEIERHVRIKILNEKGADQANIHLRYQSYQNQVKIQSLQAQTYNLDQAGNIVAAKVEKKDIFDKKITKRVSEYAFTFPDAKAGSIIEYKYTQIVQGGIALPTWHFQKEIPVVFSQYKVDFPGEVEIHCETLCDLPVNAKKDAKSERNIQVYSMSEVPALRDEPYITTDDDYVQRLVPRIIAFNTTLRRYNLIKTWPEVIKNMMEDEDFGIQLKRNLPRTADLDAQLKTLSDPYAKMVAIHNYVKKNMEWNGYYGIWAIDGVKSAWNVKKGSTGEINLILVNLLKDAGLSAHPILVSTKSNGRVNTSFADYDQFDKVLAHVVINDHTYILDATDKYTPARLIPLEVMYSEGLVIEKLDTYEWGWTTLWNEKLLSKDLVFVQGKVNEDGNMEGKATVTNYDYSRVKRAPKLKEGKDKYLETYFAANNPGFEFEHLEFQNDAEDSLPLIQTVDFKQQLNASGDYRYFSANLFTGLEKNPFVAETRFSDVFFATNQYISVVGSFSIPEDYEFEELPKNIRMIMPDTSCTFKRIVGVQNNELTVRMSVEFSQPFYSVEQYPYFQEFYKKLFAVLNEQFVIKKKAKA